jgi:thiamine biosynthesis lipoprotein
MNRRRFLNISAAALAVPGAAPAATETRRWTGRALGADVRIALTGPKRAVAKAVTDCTALLQEVEAEFSLFEESSALSRLNRTGTLIAPSARMQAVLDMADKVHRWTGGRFDPTVQPLWRTLFTGGDVETARRAIGWDRVHVDADAIRLGPGQALTLNGIAQGFATDLVADLLRLRGFETALVDLGEMRALGGPWQVGLSDPVQGMLARQGLTDAARATSSPGAMQLGARGHILDPLGSLDPQWSTVSVEANSAALADGLSTAMVFASRDEVARVKARVPGVQRVWLVSGDGALRQL